MYVWFYIVIKEVWLDCNWKEVIAIIVQFLVENKLYLLSHALLFFAIVVTINMRDSSYYFDVQKFQSTLHVIILYVTDLDWRLIIWFTTLWRLHVQYMHLEKGYTLFDASQIKNTPGNILNDTWMLFARILLWSTS